MEHGRKRPGMIKSIKFSHSRMDRECPKQNSPPVQLEPEDTELQLQVDFFRKLGYSSLEVNAALKKLGVGTDTNSVLGELVGSRTNSEPPVPNPDSDDNIYHNNVTPPPSHAEDRKDAEDTLKPIVIDGSNVAMSHGNKEVFSCHGIQLAVNFFLDRGHTCITVFVPSWRKELPRPDAPIRDQHILAELEKWKIVVFTPSRRVGGKRVVCYDDRFIVKLAHESGGIIVSNDTYRDLQGERPEWKRCIEDCLLMYSFVNDKFMPPDDPLGRHGPSLDNFLRKNPLPAEQRKQLCPYDKKCTYGIKCKFYHPERANHSYRSLADELRENARAEEKRNASVSPGRQPRDRGYPARYSPFLHSSLEFDVEHKLSLGERGPQHPGETIGCWDVASHSGGQPRPFVSVPARDLLDSGLGSYENQCSEVSQGRSVWPWHPHLQHPPSTHLIPQDAGTHTAPSASQQKWRPKPEPRAHPGYEGYPAPSMPHHHYSLPGHVLQPSAARPQQQKYWSEPYHHHHHHHPTTAPPQPYLCSHSLLSGSLPGSPAPSPGSGCCYGENRGQSQPWARSRPPPVPFDPERLELRNKLQAIFQPRQVDTVMGMFPHLMDAQKLAAEILNLKARGGVL